MHKTIIFILIIGLLYANYSLAFDTSYKSKPYYIKQFDKVIIENFYRDTGYHKAQTLNDSTIVINNAVNQIYLIKYFHERKLIYVYEDTIILNKKQPKAIEQLNRLISLTMQDVTIDSVREIWKSLSLFQEVDTNYYKSLLTDCLLYNQIEKYQIKDTSSSEISIIFNDCIRALGYFKYKPNLCTKWPLYAAYEKDKKILTQLKEWHGVDISKIFDLNEQYSDWHNMTSDSLKNIHNQLSDIAKRNPQLTIRHRYLFEIPLSINRPIVLQDNVLDSFNLNSQLENKYTILYFWGTWCAPCIKVGKEILPVIQERIKGNSNIQLFTIASESNSRKDKWLADIKKNKSRLNNLIAVSEMKDGWSGPATPQPLQLLEIFMVPNFFVIGPNKEIILRNDINGKETLNIIDKLLKSKPSSD